MTIDFENRLESDTWCTPQWLAYLLGRFDLDPCSNPHSFIQSDETYSLEEKTDGLHLPWWGRVFCNPPYSDPLPWAEKAVRSVRETRGVSVTFLLVNDVTPQWYGTLIENGAMAYPVRARVAFRNAAGNKTKIPQWGCNLITLGCYLPDVLRPYVWCYERTRFQ